MRLFVFTLIATMAVLAANSLYIQFYLLPALEEWQCHTSFGGSYDRDTKECSWDNVGPDGEPNDI